MQNLISLFATTSRFLLILSIFTLGFQAQSWARVETSGRATFLYENFLSDPAKAPANLQKSGTLAEVEPVLQISGDTTRFRLKGIAGYDYTYNEVADRALLIPEEGFVEGRFGKWNLLGGYNTYTWGVTDVLNPLDPINPRNYRNPFSPTKIGVPSLSISWGGDTTSVEVVYIPRQTPHQLPPASSRALPRGVSFDEYASYFYGTPITTLPTTALNFHYESTQDYGNPFTDNYAIRIRQTVGRLETHLVGFEGMPSFPQTGLLLNVTNSTLTDQVGIIPRYERIRMGGIGMVYSTDSVIFRGAFAQTWRTTSDQPWRTGTNMDIDLPQTGIVAVERTTNIKGNDVTFLLQYVSQKDKSGQPPSPYALSQVFDDSWMPGIRFAHGVDFSMMLGSIYNPSSKATLTSADMQIRLTDQVQLKFTGIYLAGGKLLEAAKPASQVETGLNIFW